MKLIRKFSQLSAAIWVCAVIISPAVATTFNVTTTADSGAGSLRQAINDANTNAGADTIAFQIPGTGVKTITLATGLPTITGPVTIDGYTQPGAAANTLSVGDNAVILIRIDGSAANPVLELGAKSDGSIVRGLAIVNGATVIVARSPNNVITGNFIGVDTDGATFAGASGTAVNPTTGSAGTTVGGSTPAARNLIAASGNDIVIDDGNVTVQGNYFNLNAAGTAALTAASTGVAIDVGSGSRIGGAAAGTGNVFGAWRASAINISQVNVNFPVTNQTVQGNLIGTNAAGTSKLNGGLQGIALGAINGVTVSGNVISGAQNSGVVVTGTLTGAVVIQGNKIGTDITGTKPIPNGQAGVFGQGNTTSVVLGGVQAGQGNIIAFNGTQGVDLADGNNLGWKISGNSIFSNTGLGISLNGRVDIAASPTPNDAGDPDVGANNLQNYPLITSVTFAGSNVTIAGTLNSTPSSTFRLEFFSNPSRDPSGFGEGKTFLGGTDVTTNASGDASFNMTFPVVAQNEPVITATATDSLGNTSEFSAAFASRLQNISTRMKVLTDDNVLIGGFIITGSDQKKVIIRGLGPSLTNVGQTLADPILELHGDASAANDNWKDTQRAEIEATGIPPSKDAESAIVSTLNPGSYTAILAGKNRGTGVGLVEVYDLSISSGSILANISTRGFVDTGDNVMIGGFIVGPTGTGAATVLLRGIGPSLATAGLQNTLADPVLELHDSNGGTIATNDNWKIDDATGNSQQAAIEATLLPPKNDRESAILRTVPPGNYTGILKGKNNTTGVALVEIYNL